MKSNFRLSVLIFMVTCSYSTVANALPSYKGCSDVKVGITAFERSSVVVSASKGFGWSGRRENITWTWRPNVKKSKNGRFYVGERCSAEIVIFRGIVYGGKCDPAWESSEAGDYYNENVADLQILPKTWSKDAYDEKMYQELVKAKECALERRQKKANDVKSAELFNMFKSFLGQTIGKKIEEGTLKRAGTSDCQFVFEPEKGLEGFTTYLVRVSPKSRRIYKIEAERDKCTIDDALKIKKVIEGRYVGLQLKEGKCEGKSKQWSLKMKNANPSKSSRRLAIWYGDEKCRVTLVDLAGEGIAKDEAAGKCVKCRGKGRVAVKVKCSRCRGTGKGLCEDCKGTGLVPCGDCCGSKRKCRQCHGKGKVKCMMCNKGIKSDECYWCKCGMIEKEVKCSACDGSGECK